MGGEKFDFGQGKCEICNRCLSGEIAECMSLEFKGDVWAKDLRLGIMSRWCLKKSDQMASPRE